MTEQNVERGWGEVNRIPESRDKERQNARKWRETDRETKIGNTRWQRDRERLPENRKRDSKRIVEGGGRERERE